MNSTPQNHEEIQQPGNSSRILNMGIRFIHKIVHILKNGVQSLKFIYRLPHFYNYIELKLSIQESMLLNQSTLLSNKFENILVELQRHITKTEESITELKEHLVQLDEDYVNSLATVFNQQNEILNSIWSSEKASSKITEGCIVSTVESIFENDAFPDRPKILFIGY
ncbi:MAG: hypothetical protein HQK55_07330, partial [Deltaproteobacteria bacterium]|nr:hypothetical protein [Deltaproteobacteria bacterium]